MNFADRRKKQLGIVSASEYRKSLEEIPDNPEDFIHGPEWLDCLEHKWRYGEMLGILSGPGVGKTTVSLEILRAVM